MKPRDLLLVSVLVPFAAAAAPVFKADASKKCDACEAWNAPQEPFRVFGNTYYVGVAGLSAVLIASDRGLILLDGETVVREVTCDRVEFLDVDRRRPELALVAVHVRSLLPGDASEGQTLASIPE